MGFDDAFSFSHKLELKKNLQKGPQSGRNKKDQTEGHSVLATLATDRTAMILIVATRAQPRVLQNASSETDTLMIRRYA